MRYLYIFGVLLLAGLLFAGCTAEATGNTGEVPADNESLEELPADSSGPDVEPEDVVEVQEPEPIDYSGTIGTADYQACIQKCSGGAGSGDYCVDGCRFEEASKTADTYYCDQLDQKDSIPECYGTAAIAAGDLKVCDKLTNTEDRNHCVATFLPR